MARMRNIYTSTDNAKFAWRMYRFLVTTRNEMIIGLFNYRWDDLVTMCAPKPLRRHYPYRTDAVACPGCTDHFGTYPI